MKPWFEGWFIGWLNLLVTRNLQSRSLGLAGMLHTIPRQGKTEIEPGKKHIHCTLSDAFPGVVVGHISSLSGWHNYNGWAPTVSCEACRGKVGPFASSRIYSWDFKCAFPADLRLKEFTHVHCAQRLLERLGLAHQLIRVRENEAVV